MTAIISKRNINMFFILGSDLLNENRAFICHNRFSKHADQFLTCFLYPCRNPSCAIYPKIVVFNNPSNTMFPFKKRNS